MNTRRLLVVEDHADTRALYVALLTAEGYAVEAVVDGEVAAARFEPGYFACLVTDHFLPGMSGVELIEALRTREPTLPVVLLTGASEVLRRSPPSVSLPGDVVVLGKPTGVAMLAAVVEKMVGPPWS